MKERISKCCNAPVMVQGKGDFNDNDEVCTCYYQCLHCLKSCETILVNKEKFISKILDKLK